MTDIDLTDDTLQLYLFLRDHKGWYTRLELAKELNLRLEAIDYGLSKLKKHNLINWVEIATSICSYYFHPVPAGPGSHKHLANLIEKLDKEGELSFEELGRRTGHGPRTLEGMIKALQWDQELGSYKGLNFGIKIPQYYTDEKMWYDKLKEE